MLRRVIVICSLLAFALTGGVVPVSAQMLVSHAGQLVNLSPAFTPPVLTGIKIHPKDPFRLDFILDPGPVNEGEKSSRVSEIDAQKLIRYFLAAVTVPEPDLWVNLSPYEKERITSDALGITEMGRDLLSQDYLLKQITASLMFPQGETGRQFWAQIYKLAQDKFGTTDIPVDTFNKVWIMPDKAEVFEKGNAVYVTRASLKVMLESDYLATPHNGLPDRVPVDRVGSESPSTSTSEIAKQVIREIILPLIEKEVNEGQHFASLRQVYHSLILATWYKDKIKDSILRMYVDQNKVAGVDISDKGAKEKIWAQYMVAFKKGVYNYIQEEYDPATKEIVPRRYFSGGIKVLGLGSSLVRNHDAAMLDGNLPKRDMVVQVELNVYAPPPVRGVVVDNIPSDLPINFISQMLSWQRAGVPLFTEEQAVKFAKRPGLKERFLLLKDIWDIKRDDQYLFTAKQLLRIVSFYKSGMAEEIKEELVWLKDVKGSKGQLMFDGLHITQILINQMPFRERLELVRELMELKDTDLEPLFNGFQISSIVYAKGNKKDKLDLLNYFRQQDKKYNLLLNGHELMLALSKGTKKEKRIFIEEMNSKLDAEGSPLFNAYQIGRIMAADGLLPENLMYVNQLLDLKDSNGESLFNEGQQVSDIMSFNWSKKEKFDLIDDLLKFKDVNLNQLFNGLMISQLLPRYKQLVKMNFGSILPIFQRSEIAADLIVSFIVHDGKMVLQKWLLRKSLRLNQEESEMMRGLLLSPQWRMSDLVLLIQTVFSGVEQERMLENLAIKSRQFSDAADILMQMANVYFPNSDASSEEVRPNYLDDLMNAALSFQQEEGQPLFRLEQIVEFSKRPGVQERFLLLKDIWDMQRDEEYLFSAEQLIRIVSFYKLGQWEKIKEELLWLMEVRDIKGQYLFNGSHITQILTSRLVFIDKQELIQELRKLKDADFQPLFSGFQVSRIVYAKGINKEKLDLLNYLRQPDNKYQLLLNGYDLMKALCKESIKEKRLFIAKINRKLDSDGNPMFNAYQIGKIMAVDGMLADHLIYVDQLLDLKDSNGEQLFNNGHQVSEILATNWSNGEINDLIEYFLTLKDTNSNQLFNGLMISQILPYYKQLAKGNFESILAILQRSGSPAEFIVSFITHNGKAVLTKWLSQRITDFSPEEQNLMRDLLLSSNLNEQGLQALIKALFKGTFQQELLLNLERKIKHVGDGPNVLSRMAQVYFSGKKTLREELIPDPSIDIVNAILSLQQEAGQPLFTMKQAADLNSMKYPLERVALLKRIWKVQRDGQYLFTATQLMGIVLKYRLGQELKVEEEIIWLLRRKFPDGQYVFNGSHIQQIVLSGASMQEKMAMIRYLLRQKDEELKPLFNGYHISLVLKSGLSMVEKRILLPTLIRQKDAQGKQALFNGFQIGWIMLSGMKVSERMILINEMLVKKDINDDLVSFSGIQIAEIIYCGGTLQEKRARIDSLVTKVKADGKRYFTSHQVSEVFRYHNKFTHSALESMISIFIKAGITGGTFTRFMHFDGQRLIKSWLGQQPQTLTAEENKMVGAFLRNTQFDTADLQALIMKLFEPDEQKILFGQIAQRESNAKFDLNELISHELSDADSDNIKALLLSPSIDIRKRTLNRVMEYLYQKYQHYDPHARDKILEAMHILIKRYNWQRPNAGLRNLMNNIIYVSKHIKNFSYWQELPEHVKSIILRIKRLKGMRLSSQEIEARLLKAGYTAYEIAQYSSFSLLSLDAPLQASNQYGGTFYDVMESLSLNDEDVTDWSNDDPQTNVTVMVQGATAMVRASTVGQALQSYWNLSDDREQRSEVEEAVVEGRVKVAIDGTPVDLVSALERSVAGISEIAITVEPVLAEIYADHAMSGLKDAIPGGINFTDNVNLETRDQSDKIEFSIDPAMLERMERMTGIMPVIINIQPLNNLRQFFN